ncbi:RNA pseudouridine synthase [Variovorax sp. RTB1]|uniref:RNA pseudouridine synthase n=1 Tax=Variovorax sp. RTB1 TaxID=3048631 RepID=UPI002B2271E1|nr:RNA pseudouridine synthase [Variovorax sp. RTB1]MEB0110359.1 RNA pseudouridine synthase [Variovorax sp. RTB1]
MSALDDKRNSRESRSGSVDEGVRLAKRVAAAAGCSRREAELLIESGAVRVDGEPALVPQSRVREGQRVDIEPGARPQPVMAVTLLLHKPAGTETDAAHRLLFAANHHEPERAGLRFLPHHVKAQRVMTPLETGASGLIVFTQEFRIERKLQEDAGVMEHEVIVDVEGPVGPEILDRLERTPARVSVGQQGEGHTGLRFALKGARPGQIAHICDGVGLRILSMKRIRIGRVPLAGLLPGQWRYLLPSERF